jgi:hypothetical protein
MRCGRWRSSPELREPRRKDRIPVAQQLNEALGLDLPVLAALCVKDALRKHPIYAGNVARLGSAGATIFDSTDVVVHPAPGSISLDWARILPT